jgi:hypothetical protein
MKIKKIKLTEKDKRKAYKTAVRKSAMESGLDKISRTRVFRNRKKYTRKSRQQVNRHEEDPG